MSFVFVKKLVDEWTRNGHKCVVVSVFSWVSYLRKRISYKPGYYKDEVAPRVTVDVYNARFITSKLRIGDVSVDDWLASRATSKIIERTGLKYDFVYCHFFTSAVHAFKYASHHAIPIFVATGESDIPRVNKPYKGFTLEGFRSYVSGVIAVSSKNRDEAAKIGLIDPQKCEVFPNGTDLTVFHPMDRNECRHKLNLPQDAFIISCVGFICERKGQNRLLEAVRRLKNYNIKLIFLGKEAVFESFALEGEEILFKGTVENKDIPAYLNASDVFCLPTRAEGCCNAVIEALACGLPVISSNLPFNWDVLDESNSIMMNPDSVEEIAIAINKLYKDKELRDKLARGAQVKSNSLGIKQRAEGIMSFVERKL